MRSYVMSICSLVLVGLVGCVSIGDDKKDDVGQLDTVEQGVANEPLCPDGEVLYCQCDGPGRPWVPAKDASSCASTCPSGNYIGDCRNRRDPFPGGPGSPTSL